MKKFSTARVKLTVFYSLILLFISLILSGVYYQQTAGIINIHSQRINQKLEAEFTHELPGKGPRMRGAMVKTELEAARKKILQQIIIINGVLFVFGVAASYFLSAKTLRPIKKSLASQKQFVADAAHELKTPLTALQTSVEVSLLDKKLPPSAQELLADNLIEIKNLSELTDNLLSLAQAENESQLSFSSVSLAEVVTEAVHQLQPLADKKQIKLDWTPSNSDSKKEYSVLGDQASLVKTLVILLDNAVKYSPAESKVEVNLKRKKQHITVEVVDQGRGIPEPELRKIFERFYRVEKARTKNKEGGYGLGLALAKKIIEQHQASIKVESKLGQGTRFILQFQSY